MTADGQRFLMVKRLDREAAREVLKRDYYGDRVNVVLNWSKELKQMVPSNN